MTVPMIVRLAFIPFDSKVPSSRLDGCNFIFQKWTLNKNRWDVHVIQSTEWSLNGDLIVTEIHPFRHYSVAIQPKFSLLKEEISYFFHKGKIWSPLLVRVTSPYEGKHSLVGRKTIKNKQTNEINIVKYKFKCLNNLKQFVCFFI